MRLAPGAKDGLAWVALYYNCGAMKKRCQTRACSCCMCRMGVRSGARELGR